MPSMPAALNRSRSVVIMKAKRGAVPTAKVIDVPVIRSDRVRREIADRIIAGELRPGQELDEKSLAQAFKVSRTPVREALRQLAAANLIEWRPHQSPVVAKITAASMVEMFEVMAELEGFCGHLAARRMTPSEHAALVALQADHHELAMEWCVHPHQLVDPVLVGSIIRICEAPCGPNHCK